MWFCLSFYLGGRARVRAPQISVIYHKIAVRTFKRWMAPMPGRLSLLLRLARPGVLAFRTVAYWMPLRKFHSLSLSLDNQLPKTPQFHTFPPTGQSQCNERISVISTETIKWKMCCIFLWMQKSHPNYTHLPLYVLHIHYLLNEFVPNCTKRSQTVEHLTRRLMNQHGESKRKANYTSNRTSWCDFICLLTIWNMWTGEFLLPFCHVERVQYLKGYLMCVRLCCILIRWIWGDCLTWLSFIWFVKNSGVSSAFHLKLKLWAVHIFPNIFLVDCFSRRFGVVWIPKEWKFTWTYHLSFDVCV